MRSAGGCSCRANMLMAGRWLRTAHAVPHRNRLSRGRQLLRVLMGKRQLGGGQLMREEGGGLVVMTAAILRLRTRDDTQIG